MILSMEISGSESSSINYTDEKEYDPVQEEIIEDLTKLNSTFKLTDNLILCINIRSVTKNFHKLEFLIKQMLCKPLIIICTEAWLKEQNMFVNLNGYVNYFNESKITKADGVVVYVLDYLVHNIENITIGKTESPTITIVLKDSKPIIINPIYRSPKYNLKKFSEKLFEYIEKNQNIQNHIVIGDFNVDILDDSVESKEFLGNFFAYGYEPYFKNYTRSEIGQKNTCIDNAYIKTKINIESFRLNYRLSDHYCLFLRLNSEQQFEKYKSNTNRVNNKLLIQLSNKFDWSYVYTFKDMDQATEWCVNNIKLLVENSKTSGSKKHKGKKPWLSKELIKLIDKKEKVYKRLRKNRTNETLKKEYTELGKKIRKMILVEKEKYEQKKFKNEQRKIWEFVNKKINKKVNEQ